MTTREMVNAMGGNLEAVHQHFGSVAMLGWYGTGSVGIPATAEELALFPGAELIEIDQGGAGSPVPTATVRDVENGAWSPATAIDGRPWDVERPTIYCSRDTLPIVANLGWKGDVWLAWPGYAGSSAPVFPPFNIVAVQDVFANEWETSRVFDPTWPKANTPVGPAHPLMVSVTNRVIDISFGIVKDAGHYVIEYTSGTGAIPVVIGRPPQPASGDLITLNGVWLPNHAGGTVTCYAIVNSRAVNVGAVHLP